MKELFTKYMLFEDEEQTKTSALFDDVLAVLLLVTVIPLLMVTEVLLLQWRLKFFYYMNFEPKY